jgi:O-methyltransferase/aklanonic acid methyltransferase
MAVAPEGAVAGIDLAPGMVAAVAEELQRRVLPHVTVGVGDAEAPEFPDRSFDAVLAGFVLFLLPDPVTAVRAYARLLHPGGRLAVSTFSELTEEDEHRFRRFHQVLAPYLPPSSPAPPDQSPPEQRLRTRESIAELPGKCGFTDLRFVENRYRIELVSPNQYWEWMWSGGFRGMMEQIPAHRVAEARNAFIQAVEVLGGDSGIIAFRVGVRFTTARLPR